MNERPILFKPEMVQAILDGRKSQTRRVVKPQPEKWIDRFVRSMSASHWIPSGVFLQDPGGFLGKGPLNVRGNDSPVKSPYGAPGDRFWVRESYQQVGYMSGKFHLIYSDGTDVNGVVPSRGALNLPIKIGTKKISSIHMPRWASRLTLEITAVRVERVQDITEADAMAEGADTDPMTLDDIYAMEEGSIERKLAETLGPGKFSARFDFKMIWNSIHSKDGYEWNANPWVWVYTFKRVEP